MNKYLILIFLSPVLLLLNPFLSKAKGIVKFSACFFLSVVIALTCMLYINKADLIDSEQRSLMHDVSAFKQHTTEEKAYRFVGENMILIDNSFNKSETPYPDGTEGDGTSEIITDRKTLTSFFNWAYAEPNTDFIVCDIAITDGSQYDLALKTVMDKMISKGKLLLSHNPAIGYKKILHFPDSVFGNVQEESSENIYTSHTIQQTNTPKSLAFKIYAKLNQLTANSSRISDQLLIERGRNNWALAMNTFIPVFSILDEQRLCKGSPALENHSALKNSTYMPAMNLGYATTPLGKKLLSDEMSQRKRRKMHNVIFIGALRSSDEDIHATTYGKLHGVTIILNNVFALTTGRHHFSILLFFILTSGLTIIHLLILRKIDRSNLRSKNIHRQDIRRESWHPYIERAELYFSESVEKLEFVVKKTLLKVKFGKYIRNAKIAKAIHKTFHLIYFFVQFMISEIPQFVILLILVVLIAKNFEFILNFSVLFIYFVVFEKCITYFASHKIKL